MSGWFLKAGYEIVMTNFKARTIENRLEGHFFIGLYCEKCEEKYIRALSTPIFEYASSFFELYNKNKRRPAYTWVSDPSVFWKFEESLRSLLQGDLIIMISTVDNNKMKNMLKSFLETERNLYSNIGRFNDIFFAVCIVNELNGSVNVETISKDLVKIKQINRILADANKFDTSIALSFFILSKKYKQFSANDDLMVGIIIYDLKNRQTLALNTESVTTYGSNFILNSQTGLFEIANYLFEITINNGMNLITKLPLSLGSLYYTPISWLEYVILENNPNEFMYEPDKDTCKLKIPEIFIFGYNDLRIEHSFDHNSLSNNRGGHSTFLFNLNDEFVKIKYNLRFDQSPGEELLHLDFGFYKDNKQYKLISHKIVDFEEVYKLNQKLYMAMVFAGLFDAHFNTILPHIQGIENLNSLDKLTQ